MVSDNAKVKNGKTNNGNEKIKIRRNGKSLWEGG